MSTEMALTVSDWLRLLDATEHWRPIEGWPGYEISSWGRVSGKRCDFLVPKETVGYLIVTLSNGKLQKNFRVHILVAQTFLGPPPFKGALVAHNDRNTLNCRLLNLRWASALENSADMVRHGTRPHGSAVFGSKLVEDQIPIIRARIRAGENQTKIGEDFGVSKYTISLIKKGKIWKGTGGAAWKIPTGNSNQSLSELKD